MTTDALLHWLARTSLEASLLILAVLGLRLMLGTRLNPAWRIGLWMLVGIKLMLPAFIPAGFGLGGWFQPDAPEARSASMALSYSPDLPSTPQSTTPAISSTAPIHEMASGLSTHSRSSFSISEILLAVWLAGAITVLAVAILRQHRFASFLHHRPRASNLRLSSLLSHLSSLLGIKSPEIVLMPSGTTPALVGISRPQILLPEDWESRFDDRSLRHVVLHELLHVKQCDLLWNWAATAVQALHWFNPLVWFVVSRFQADRELRCDAGALEILAPSERLDYGHTLLRIQETFFAPPTIAGLAPCVRNHPTLRQRILMIATPTTRQPWLHALLVLTLSLLVGYSFTTARAQEKEVPPKVRGGDAPRSAETGKPATGEREGGEKKPAMREGDGGARKPGMRDGEGGAKKPGTGDGEGARKPGMRDGDKPRTGERDGDKPRTGERDGDKPRTGARDGEGGPKTGARDGEGSTKTRKGDGDSASVKSSEVITMHVPASGGTILINGEERPLSGLRGHLSTFLPEHPGAKVIVSGDADTPHKSLLQVLDAVRDNGNKNVGIKAE